MPNDGFLQRLIGCQRRKMQGLVPSELHEPAAQIVVIVHRLGVVVNVTIGIGLPASVQPTAKACNTTPDAPVLINVPQGSGKIYQNVLLSLRKRCFDAVPNRVGCLWRTSGNWLSYHEEESSQETACSRAGVHGVVAEPRRSVCRRGVIIAHHPRRSRGALWWATYPQFHPATVRDFQSAKVGSIQSELASPHRLQTWRAHDASGRSGNGEGSARTPAPHDLEVM